MTKADWGAFSALIKTSDELTLGKPRSSEAIALFFNILLGRKLEDIRRAVSQHMTESKFAITPADIMTRIDGSKEDLAVLGWRMFLKAWERYGIYASVRFPHPAYHYAIEQYGGWVKLLTEWRDLQEEELHFRAKEWQRLYGIGLKCASWRSEHGKVKVLSHLAGLHEIQNCAGGYLQHLPDVIAVDTGEAVGRGALAAGEQAAATGLLEGFKMPQLSVIGGD